MSITVGLMAAVLLLGMTGCSDAGSATSAGSTSTSATTGQNMAGPAVQVNIPQSVVSARPQPWVLSTPESAVRSYLDWTSYGYRIASSDVASPTMSGKQGVRVDSFIQFNLEKSKLLDESLTSISFGKPTVESTHTLVPARELWSYSYRSIAVGNKVLGGPYSLSYDTTYTVIKPRRWARSSDPAVHRIARSTFPPRGISPSRGSAAEALHLDPECHDSTRAGVPEVILARGATCESCHAIRDRRNRSSRHLPVSVAMKHEEEGYSTRKMCESYLCVFAISSRVGGRYGHGEWA